MPFPFELIFAHCLSFMGLSLSTTWTMVVDRFIFQYRDNIFVNIEKNIFAIQFKNLSFLAFRFVPSFLNASAACVQVYVGILYYAKQTKYGGKKTADWEGDKHKTWPSCQSNKLTRKEEKNGIKLLSSNANISIVLTNQPMLVVCVILTWRPF